MNFEIIIDKYSNLAYKIAINMLPSPEDAQDIVQEAYLKLYSHYKEYRKLQENEIKNILCKIVLNNCKDYLKSNKNLEKTSLEEISNINYFVTKDNFLDNLITNENSKYIKQEIQNLKHPYNKLLELYYIQEKNLDEIADMMQTSKGTVKVQITRGKQLLKEILRKEQYYE